MKAIVYTKYGPPNVLKLKEVEKPTPRDNEILIKIHAATVNRTDCGFRAAYPYPLLIRFFSGIIRPRRTILGTELAGKIEAVGKDVKLFKKGDVVFGLSTSKFGTHAQYLCLPEDGSIAIKPANMTYEEAAAVCDGAIMANAFFQRVNLKKDQKILVNGGSGSIGSAAVQLSKSYGLDVTAVCGTKNIKTVKSLGANKVIDYTKDDFTKIDETFDYVFDAVGKSSFGVCKRLLKPRGSYCSTDLGFLYQNPFLALWTSKFGKKKVIFPIPSVYKKDIQFLKKLIEKGKFKAVIDRKYSLEQIVEAHRYVDKGHKKGNVVITVKYNNKT